MPLATILGKNLVAAGSWLLGLGRGPLALTLPQSPCKVPAMAKGDHTGPRLSARGEEELAARRDRQARALRENLRKRAAQRRGRAEPNPAAPVGGGGPGPGGGPKGEA